MVTCIAWGCKNRSQGIGGHVGFHTFPLKNPALLKKWLDALRISSRVLNKYCRVCSDHFSPQDYKRDFRHELIGTRRKRILREDAVPWVGLCHSAGIMEETVTPEGMDERIAHDPLSDPLAEDSVEILPEFEIKEEPYDFYEDNITDTGSPCWISDGVTLGENDDDIELEDGIQLEDNSDPFDYGERVNNSHEDIMDVLPIPKYPNKGRRWRQRSYGYSRKILKNFVPYEIDVDDDMDDDLMVTVENAAATFKDDLEEFGWRHKRMTDADLARRRRELETHLMRCKVNIKVMQSRLDEERGKMLRMQNMLLNIRRRQKRHEMKKMQYGAGGGIEVVGSEGKNSLHLGFEGGERKKETLMAVKMRMARLRDIKAKKALDQKRTGVVDYQKELENKLRMARLREIKAQKALERKLNIEPEVGKTKLKPLKIPKPEECGNGEDYEKMLEAKLKTARLREIKAMKALEKVKDEDSDKTDEYKIKIKKPKVKRLKINMKTNKPYNEFEMKAKMAKLREIKAQKAMERKKLEESGETPMKYKMGKKRIFVKKRKLVNDRAPEAPSTSNEGETREEINNVNVKTEEKEKKPEVHIATSHMLWNVLSRIKMEPYQESSSTADPNEALSNYFSNQGKNNPSPSDIPKLVKDFMCRDDVSKISTTSPYATSNSTSSVRYRMHYLPILHKQFEAENGNVCSYASFCSNVPECVIKPNGWQWKFCPCLPCINPELKFEKMISEGILKMEGIELGDILYDDAKENVLMVQLRDLRDSRQFFTYDSWERNSSGTINAKRRTASEPITTVVTKFLEELSMLKSHIQRSFYQYHAAKLARDRGLQCPDEVTLHIECSPLSLYRNPGTDSSTSDPAAVFTFLTGYLWSQNCEQALAAVSENKDYSTSGIWAGLEKILLSIVKAGKRKINIISDSPTNKYRNKSNFYYMSDFARMYGVCFRWIFLELSHQIGNADIIRFEIERTIKDELAENPDMSMAKSDIQKLVQSRTSIIVDSYSHDDVQKYKWNLPKLKVVQGTQKFDEVIILPEDFWVRDVIGFDTFKKLPF
ncbi:uncharacterized protein [Palaemon carinicauda]|uniref:uncharacterized protein isoform X2 n=1 Tax=Palaemon carinicauda TaxID=392227 RepID=UPI0035B6A1AB